MSETFIEKTRTALGELMARRDSLPQRFAAERDFDPFGAVQRCQRHKERNACICCPTVTGRGCSPGSAARGRRQIPTKPSLTSRPSRGAGSFLA